MIIVATRIGKVATCSRKYIGNVMREGPECSPEDDARRADAGRPRAEGGIVTSSKQPPIVVAIRSPGS